MNKLVKFTAALLLSVTFANADGSQADAKALVEKGVAFCKKGTSYKEALSINLCAFCSETNSLFCI